MIKQTKKRKANKKFWLITVNMGYGHLRTAFCLKKFAFKKEVISVNDYKGIPDKDKKTWRGIRTFYEYISSLYQRSLLGKVIFNYFDKFQRIFNFYPKRDLTKPNFQLKQTMATIKSGWGKHLIESLYSKKFKKPLPFVTTFFTPAFMAEYFNYPGDIYCITCDTDVSRTWAPLKPQESRIKYFASTPRVAERLKLYGVKPKNIFLTGHPLPLENIGTKSMGILKKDLKNRILNLDPEKKYYSQYKVLIDKKIGKLPKKSDHLLTLMFSVGGAGAQSEIAIRTIKSLKEKILEKEIKIIFSAGIKEKVKKNFEKEINKNLLESGGIEIIYKEKFEDYFKEFNKKFRKTDILWTKPSELSFYTSLGVPIVIAPTIGSQEEFNQKWLLNSGFGFLQGDPYYAHQWLFDWIKNGYLAEAAMQGFVEGEKFGVLNIKKIIET